MQEHKHENEARFVETVLNWHKANDGRGLGNSKMVKWNHTFKPSYSYQTCHGLLMVTLQTMLLYVCGTGCVFEGGKVVFL